MKDRIKRIRKEIDLTQCEFAKRIGTTANVLTNYETGRRNPSASVINNICKTFGVNEEWLRTGEGEIFLKTPDTLIEQLKQKYSMDDFETSIVEEYLNLPADKRAVFKEFIYKLASKAQTSGEEPDKGDALRAAHARTDKKSTPEGQKHDWDIMMNDDEWE